MPLCVKKCKTGLLKVEKDVARKKLKKYFKMCGDYQDNRVYKWKNKEEQKTTKTDLTEKDMGLPVQGYSVGNQRYMQTKVKENGEHYSNHWERMGGFNYDQRRNYGTQRFKPWFGNHQNQERYGHLIGCTGSLAKQHVSTYKESTVTIMDLPKVVQAVKKHFVTDKEQQIHFLEGDFFNDAIPEADLFILARIIHDWTEEKCIKLLTKVYQSCRPGGGVLIVELLLNEDKSGPVISQVFSLQMLVQAEGKERTPSEYTKLLTDSGFRDIKVKATGKMYDAILGRK
ncbi:acetylserotonin O-methyltransferase-like [Bufo gargarizans]|uniref:acetylserotonin O-methyltransferase-like n=1 Tax=Bufo gargarizans TaxID=30331 RepID=UPI001CF42C5E|nr:acetylserotonin O-methyltransferase-like [Bufo gargarizans]